MTREEFQKLIADFRREQDEIMFKKNEEYTRGEDNVIANFIRTAEAAGITVEQAWGVMISKQFDAIMNWVKGNQLKSETLASRLFDLSNFVLLLLPIIERKENKKQDSSQGKYYPPL